MFTVPRQDRDGKDHPPYDPAEEEAALKRLSQIDKAALKALRGTGTRCSAMEYLEQRGKAPLRAA